MYDVKHNMNNYLLCCPAVSISCFQCNSTDIDHQFLCTENMEDSDSLRPQPCTSINDAAYCVTLIGLHSGNYDLIIL